VVLGEACLDVLGGDGGGFVMQRATIENAPRSCLAATSQLHPLADFSTRSVSFTRPRQPDMEPRATPEPVVVATDAPAAARPVNKRHLETAVHHANVLEERKQVEGRVLEAILTLMDFPTSPEADPKRPTASDALLFTEAIAPFQPADYDSLIEERNIADKCGYALCPRPKRRAPSTAKKQFIDTAKGVQIVDKKTLEVWCSDDCARRALYVKVQLNEEPAWLRQGSGGTKIELMVENAEEFRAVLPLRLKQEPKPPAPKPEEEDIAAAWAARDDALADLAVERGETPGRLSKANKELVQDRIRERVASAPPVPPSLPEHSLGQSHMAIEGHIPKSTKTEGQSDDEDAEQDWDKHLPG